MPYYHARVNAMRVGVTRVGLAAHALSISVGGVAKTPKVDGFQIVSALDGSPSTCTFTLEQATAPTMFSTVTLSLGGSLVWGGTLTEVRAVAQKLKSGAVFWDCQAIDWTWLLDRYARVTLDTGNGTVSANTLTARILTSFSNGGFATGYISDAIGAVGPFVFQAEPVSGALRRISAAANTYFRIRPSKVIDMFTTLPTSNALTMSNSSAVRDVRYESSGSQTRTKAVYIGGGGSTTAVVSAGAATVPVDECAWYTGTQAHANGSTFTYSGRTMSSGPGSLTGCSGIDRDLPQGEQVSVVGVAEDAAAQATLATALGGGLSGIAIGWFVDGRLTQTEAADWATGDVSFYKSAVTALGYTTVQRYHEPGKTISVSVTSPFAISGDYRIQRVTTKVRGKAVGTDPSYLEHVVECRLARRADVLDDIRTIGRVQ